MSLRVSGAFTYLTSHRAFAVVLDPVHVRGIRHACPYSRYARGIRADPCSMHFGSMHFGSLPLFPAAAPAMRLQASGAEEGVPHRFCAGRMIAECVSLVFE